MRKYNLLVLAQDFFIGGAEVVLYRLLKHINKRRFNCILCCYKKSGKVIRLIEETKTKIEILKETKDREGQLKKLVKKHKIDIAYVTSYKLLPEAIVLKSLGCKVIYNMQNLLVHTHKRLTRKQKEMFLTTLFCLSDKIIACSNAVKKQFDFLKSRRHIEVVYNGVEVNKFLKLRTKKYILKKEYSIPHDTKIVAVIGRVEPKKEQRLFIKACKRIKESYNKVKFFIIGSCESTKYLKIIKDDIKRLSLVNNIFLTGLRSDIEEIIQDIDIIVLPSSDEGFPLSLVEGMIAGKAVISTNTGGVLELIKNNKTGLLVDPRDEKGLCRAVLSLLNNTKKRYRLGCNAKKEAIKRYGIDIFMNKIERILTKLRVS